MTAPHPRQPVVLDHVGTARFRENAIVRHLLDNGGLDLNALHRIDFSDDEWEQFVQLIGYSVSGTVGMEYVSTDVWNAAQAEADALVGSPAPVPRPLNGCHNKPRPTEATTHVAQAGWRDLRDGFGQPCPVPVYVDIPHRMSTTCQYDKSATDKGCAGCVHGEQRP